MDDYQKYIQSGSDNQNTSGGYRGGGNFSCSTIVWIVIGIVFLIFWYSNGGT